MFARFGRFSAALIASAVVLGACDGSDLTNVDGSGDARLTVQLTDAPGDLAEAWVKIDAITLQRSGEGEGNSGEPVKLTPKSTDWIDLLTLSGGQVADLVTEQVPAGTYTQVRVTVCDMYIKTTDGDIIATADAELPSGVEATAGTELKLTSQCHSGFKVNFPEGGVTLDEGNTTLVIDFDAARSFAHQAGKSGKWIVTPVLHGLKKESGEVAGGTISGTVTLPTTGLVFPLACGGVSLADAAALLAKFVPTATVGTTTLTGTTTSAGAFTIANVPAGTYTLGTEEVAFENGDKLVFTVTPSPTSVTLNDGQTATVTYAVTAASCQLHT